MQTLPGMTQQQRQAAGDSYRQFQTRLFGNRGQNIQTPAGRNPATLAPVMQPQGKTLKGPTSSPAPTKAPDMDAYKPQPSGGTPMAEAYADWQRRNPGAMPSTGPRPPSPAPTAGGANGSGDKPYRMYSDDGYRLARPSGQGPQGGAGPASAQWDGVFTKYYDWRTGGSTSSPPPPRPADAPGDVYWNAGMDPREVYKSPSAPAQPIQPQPQGTPYNPMQPMVFETMAERTTRRQPDAPPPTPRPSEFQTTMTGFDGRSYDPKQFFAQRDAFIQRLNEERGRQSAQSGVYGRGEAPQFYQPSRDFGAMWGQAGDMVRGGWANPLAGLFG